MTLTEEAKKGALAALRNGEFHAGEHYHTLVEALTAQDVHGEVASLLKDLKAYIETGKYDHEKGYPRRIDEALALLGKGEE